MDVKFNEEMKKVVICKYCGKTEYYGEMRWFNGVCSCRTCYKKNWESRNGHRYTWTDLDGPKPTIEEINKISED